MLNCNKIGDFCFQLDTKAKFKTTARIIPGFGCNVLPECFFLKKDFNVNKKGKQMKVFTPDGRLAATAESFKYNENWLFYSPFETLQPHELANSRQATSSRKPFVAKTTFSKTMVKSETSSATMSTIDEYPGFAFHTALLQGELERARLLPLDHCFAAKHDIAATAENLMLWHRKLGHRNFRDVMAITGLKLPTNVKPPICVDCIRGKSKRHALTQRAWGIHEAPRPGYAWAWDHCGPFRIRTWGGANYLSLKVDIYSGKLVPAMTNTTASCYDEWSAHVLKLESHHGRKVVARMITDNAPYFRNNRLLKFNESRGIIHVPTPSYTQEFNPAERQIAIVIEMSRTNMLQSCAPDKAYGEAVNSSCCVINTCPSITGGKLSRNEKYEGRLLPSQHDRLRVWGCAAYVHRVHGKRGNIGNPGKMDDKTVLGIMVGYNDNGLGWRVALLPNFKIVTTVHVTFVESSFPCKTTTGTQLPNFLTPEQQQRLLRGPAAAALAPQIDEIPDQRQRSAREWAPSAKALQNIAQQAPQPPSDFDEAFAQADDPQAFLDELDFDTVHHVHNEVVQATDDDERRAPKTAAQALTGEDKDEWTAAIKSEYNSHTKNKTWGPALKELPKGFRGIPLDVIFKIKRNRRKKARAIIKGFYLQAGIDFNETFAPVPVATTIRILLALAAKFGWNIKQGDIATAFLAADMDTEVYIMVPSWFTDNPDPAATGYTLHRLLKGIPGIPQGPRLFHNKSKAIYTANGLQQCKSDHALYYCGTRKLFLVVWVDDLFLFYPPESSNHANNLWASLQQELDLGDMEDIDDCLGCKVNYDQANRRLSISQRPSFKALLLKSGMDKCNHEHTPMSTATKLSIMQCPDETEKRTMTEELKWYRSIIASFIHFCTWTRPDMAKTVSSLCRYMHNPGKTHITALKRLLRYLASTIDKGLVYDFSQTRSAKTGVYGYYDAAHADCVDTMKSTLAYVYFFEGCTISWHTKLHSLVTTSTNHSEYCAAAKAGREAKWIEKIFIFLGYPQFVRPIHLFSDSKGSIAMTYNPVNRSASKHVDLADHYARELQELGTITVTHVGTADMTADILTKALGRPAHERHSRQLIGDC